MSASSTKQITPPYDLVIDSVHFWCVGLVDAVVFGTVDTQHYCLLERPSSDVPGELRIAGGDTIGERLPCILIAKELDAAGKNDTRVLNRLEACDEAEVTACPETFAVLLCGVDDSGGTRVVGGIGCEARRRCAKNGDEVRAVAERVWGAGEPDGGGAWSEDGGVGDLYGDECWGFFTVGVVGDERCAGGRGNEGELGSEGGKRCLFWRERDEEVGVF